MTTFRILIVDDVKDEAIKLEGLVKELWDGSEALRQGRKAAFKRAENAIKAIQLIDSFHPDLVIADVFDELNREDTIITQVFRHVESWERPPVVVVSSNLGEEATTGDDGRLGPWIVWAGKPSNDPDGKNRYHLQLRKAIRRADIRPIAGEPLPLGGLSPAFQEFEAEMEQIRIRHPRIVLMRGVPGMSAEVQAASQMLCDDVQANVVPTILNHVREDDVIVRLFGPAPGKPLLSDPDVSINVILIERRFPEEMEKLAVRLRELLLSGFKFPDAMVRAAPLKKLSGIIIIGLCLEPEEHQTAPPAWQELLDEIVDQIEIPALTQRQDDIPPLFRQKLESMRSGGGAAVRLTAAAEEALKGLDWGAGGSLFARFCSQFAGRMGGDIEEAEIRAAFARLDRGKGPVPAEVEGPLDEVLLEITLHEVGDHRAVLRHGTGEQHNKEARQILSNAEVALLMLLDLARKSSGVGGAHLDNSHLKKFREAALQEWRKELTSGVRHHLENKTEPSNLWQDTARALGKEKDQNIRAWHRLYAILAKKKRGRKVDFRLNVEKFEIKFTRGNEGNAGI